MFLKSKVGAWPLIFNVLTQFLKCKSWVNNHQIKFARTEDDVIKVIQNYSENKSPLLVTVDVSFSKNEIVDKLPSLYSNIAIDVIVRSTDDLIELPKLYKEYLSNMKVYMSKNKDAQILMSFRKKN